MQIKKRINILLASLAILFSFSALAGNFSYELKVDGMSCPFCAHGVEKKLKGLDGVMAVEVNIGKGSVQVEMKQDSDLTEDQAKKAVKDAGFSLKDFKKVGE